MMKETYPVKYRSPGRRFFKTVKNVKEDGMTDKFRWLRLENDILIHFPMDSEVIFTEERQAVITHQMSREAGIPVQRA